MRSAYTKAEEDRALDRLMADVRASALSHNELALIRALGRRKQAAKDVWSGVKGCGGGLYIISAEAAELLRTLANPAEGE